MSAEKQPKSDLSIIEDSLGLPGLAERLRPALEGSAEPHAAPARAVRLLEAAATHDLAGLAELWKSAPGGLVRVLWTLGGASPFLVNWLIARPRQLLALAREEFSIPRSVAAYTERLDIALREAGDDPAELVLRRVKYYELARITVRELSDDLVPVEKTAETLAELSDLADALLSRSLKVVTRRIEERFGPPRWRLTDGRECELAFCVLGLGKLGSRELNYSSDVDLIYVHTSAPGEAVIDPGQSLPAEYFTRLGQAFGKFVSENNAEGFLYRVDLDLRPEGAQGPLVVSDESIALYYEAWAATWEKAAFMKARPVAGDAALGGRVIRAIDPMIFRSSMDFGGVAAIKEMKERIEREVGRRDTTFNVKIGPGGIRDLEFVAQAHQLLYGGRIPQVRSRSTQDALLRIAQVGIFSEDAGKRLIDAYRFLRRTENRIQLEHERQTHQLPGDAAGLERIARAMGFGEPEPIVAFKSTLNAHRERVREAFNDLFYEGRVDQILEFFTRSVPSLFRLSTRYLVERLAEQFSREIDASADPERAMNNLERFIRGVAQRLFYYQLLLDRPELIARLVRLFASSDYLSEYFARMPRLIEPIFSDPTKFLFSKDELAVHYREVRSDILAEDARDPFEAELDALRRFRNREVLNVGLLDLDEKITLDEAESALTDIAEVCIDAGVAIARSQMGRYEPEGGREVTGAFLVVGMGKLGSREISYGADLDLIFLFDGGESAHYDELLSQEYHVRLAQKFITTLQTRTLEGACYEIDARLRPSGGQGMLVSSLGSFSRYHDRGAWAWERQALLRARPVAGPEWLGEAFNALRREILLRPAPEDLRAQVAELRQRMESELGKESPGRHDFKTGRGGLVDVEFIVQYLQLRHGAEHPDLLEPLPVARLLDRLAGHGLLSEEQHEILSEGWHFLRRLSSRLRVVQNQSISDLDEERGDLDALAHRLGYPKSERAGARRALLRDYAAKTDAIREIFKLLVYAD